MSSEASLIGILGDLVATVRSLRNDVDSIRDGSGSPGPQQPLATTPGRVSPMPSPSISLTQPSSPRPPSIPLSAAPAPSILPPAIQPYSGSFGLLAPPSLAPLISNNLLPVHPALPPASTSLMPPATLPNFMGGTQQLGVSFPSLATSQVNAARMDSAARQRAPSRRTSRGRAYPSVTLGPSGPSVHASSSSAASAALPHTIDIAVRVIPPLNGSDGRPRHIPIFFRQRRAAWDDRLESVGLKFDLTGVLVQGTSLSDVCNTIEARLAAGPFHYITPTLAIRPSSTQFERLAFLVLVPNTRHRHNTKFLKNVTHLSDEEMQISSMIRVGSAFVKTPEHSHAGNKLNLYLAFKLGPLRAHLPGRAPRLHSCIGRRVEHMFSNDSLEQQLSLEQEANGHHLSSEDLSSDEEYLDAEDLLIEEGHYTASQAHDLHEGHDASPPVVNPLHLAIVTPRVTLTSGPFGRRLFEDVSHVETQYPGLASTTILTWKSLSRQVANGTAPGVENRQTVEEVMDLNIRGTDIADVAMKLRKNAELAVREGDGTRLVPARYHVAITGRLEEQSPHVISFGEGINTEACTSLFDDFNSRFSQYFITKAGGFLSIAPGPSTIHPLLAFPNRREDMQVLGACTLYALVSTCRVPAGLSPFLMQLVVNDFNIHSLTEDFVSTFAPEAYETVMQWRLLGPAGNANTEPWRSIFLNLFQDIHPSTLRQRTAVAHDAMESMLLQHLLVGPITDDMEYFGKGFKTTFRSGYNICDLIHSFEGGSAAFFTAAAGGIIRSFEDIKPLLGFNSMPGSLFRATLTDVTARLQELTNPEVHLHDYINNFLTGTGKVHDQAFDDAQAVGLWAALSPDDLDDRGFRSRIFYRACTGSNITLPDGTVTVAFNAATQDGPKAGFLEWKTCFHKVIIPARWLLRYLEGTDPTAVSYGMSPETAIEFWLLTQTLIAIGHHGIA